MFKQYLTLTFLLIISSTILAQKELLQAGPMVGYSQMREVMLWVQTTETANVKIGYWVEDQKDQKQFTDEVSTQKSDAFTAHLIADEVEPGLKYDYELYINDEVVDRPYPLKFQTQVLWQYRTDPPNFTFAAGCGAHINEEAYDRLNPYGGDYEIYTSIYEKHPDFMIWGGDNIYLREADYYSRTGIHKRYTYHQSQEYLQPLWGSVHHYAIWDDHDFGPNNSDRSFHLKETTLEAFKLFWSNPSYGVNGNPGTTTFVKWGDIDFFMMDDRYYRSPENRLTTDREIWGSDQVEWLIDALTNSRAPFKFIVTGNQFLSPIPDWENHADFPAEREKVLKYIEEEGITGVIFLTGDRHFTELSKMERRGTYPLYDFTLSPFTSGANDREPEPNFYRIDGTHIGQRNFAIFDVTGKRNERILECTIFDKDGKELWKYSINENDLK